MELRTIGLILCAVAFNATGQLCLKTGARRLDGLGPLAFLRAAARDPHVLSGIAAWIAWTLCWLYALRAAPLSRAYGMTSLTYLLVPLLSVCLFGESLRRLQVAGMALILLGVACMLCGD